MSKFKRILFFAKLTPKQIKEFNLDMFETGCYSRIVRADDGHVNEILHRIQAAGITCKFIVMDEYEFAEGNGCITKDAITGGAQ